MYTLPRGRAQNRPIAPADVDIAPEWPEVLGLFAAVLLTLVLYNTGAYDVVNTLSPALLGVFGGWGMWRLVRRAPAAIWTPLFTVRASSVVFLGIGSLIAAVGPESSQEFVLRLYAYAPEEGAKTHTVFMTGYFVTILSVKLASLVHPKSMAPARVVTFSETASLRLGLIFAAFGLGFIFLIQIPILLAGGSLILPGTVLLMFGAVGAVGTFLVTLWAVERKGLAYLLVAILLLGQLFISLVMLEKTSIMMATLLVGVAFILNRATLVRILLLVLALAANLAILSPIVTQGRILHSAAHGDQTGGSIAERLNYPIEYLGGFRVGTGVDEPSSFLRLNYVSPSAFVITQYDVGMPSDTVVNGLYALIPRAVWPDKPLVSAIGTNLNEMITGADTSSLGVGVFADGYWNFGWPGLLIFVPVGMFLWWASLLAEEIVRKRDWLLMPFVLVVFRIGMSVDNFLVLAWLTPAAMSLLLLLLLRLLKELVINSLERSQTRAFPVRPR